MTDFSLTDFRRAGGVFWVEKNLFDDFRGETLLNNSV